MNRLPTRALLSALAATLGLLVATTSAQRPDVAVRVDAGERQSSPRVLVGDGPGAPIDRDLRANDPPRPVRRSLDVIDRTRNGASYVRGSIIVKFRSGVSTAVRGTVLSGAGGTVRETPSNADFELVTIPADADPEDVTRRLSSRAEVEYAQPRYRVTPRFTPNDPLYSLQWHYPMLDMERAWDINPGSASSVIVAVLDTGIAFKDVVIRFPTAPLTVSVLGGPPTAFPGLGTIDVPFAAAPDLGGTDRYVSPRDFIWNDAEPLDMEGHGTYVAGVIGQSTNNARGVAGMAFNVRIMPVKVLDNFWDEYFGSPFFATDDLVARGIRYAADNGAKVLNLSFGRTTGGPATVVRAAIEYAVSRGAFVVIAGGNDFEQGNPIERFAELAPEIDGLVSVGAIGRDRRRATYSSTGAYIELVAPGGDQTRGGGQGGILQETFDFDLTDTYLQGLSRFRAPRFDSFAYLFLQGTSAAAPHVSGLAAMLIQQGITAPAAIEAAMKRTATDLGTPGRDDESGHGLINPRAALRGTGLAR